VVFDHDTKYITACDQVAALSTLANTNFFGWLKSRDAPQQRRFTANSYIYWRNAWQRVRIIMYPRVEPVNNKCQTPLAKSLAILLPLDDLDPSHQYWSTMYATPNSFLYKTPTFHHHSFSRRPTPPTKAPRQQRQVVKWDHSTYTFWLKIEHLALRHVQCVHADRTPHPLR